MDIARQTWDRVMASHSGAVLPFGPTQIDRFLLDPKRMAFFHSRYKFAAKMLCRCKWIIDVGCGDGSGTLTFLNDTAAQNILGLDFEEQVIDYAVDTLLPALQRARPADALRLEFVARDFLISPYVNFDGLCCLDVIEHIDPQSSRQFIANLARSLTAHGVAVVGTPSLAAAAWASEHSKIGHINLYDAERLRSELEGSFSRVFMFSMNDEVVHTGFDRLAHYFLALCVK